MFSPEKPIETQSQDLLGRYGFARAISSAISEYQFEDSIVIGLYGKWGTGKSSLINLIVEDMKKVDEDKKQDEKNIIIHFNPWNYSDQNQLTIQFFNTLSSSLRLPCHAKDAIRAGEKLEIYAKFFQPLSLFSQVSVLPILFSKIFGSVGKASKKWGESHKKSLYETKMELNRHLVKLKSKIIIVIDDIDRLNNNEIRQMFQLIKSLGDFPNTVYMVAFDKDVVVNALKKVQEGSGEEYLEKMIQIPFEIPQIEKYDVENYFVSEINQLIHDIPKRKFDSTYWNNVYHSGIKHFFNNLRDVTRYINTLRFGLNQIKFEVNTVDFIALTCIQVFIPNLYEGIRNNKDVFTGVYSIYSDDSRDKKYKKEICDSLLNDISSEYSGFIKEMLLRIFPKLSAIYGNTNYGEDWLKSWRKECRICTEDKFDIYFKLQIPRGDISVLEIEDILINNYSEDKFIRHLLKYIIDEKVSLFLYKMEGYTETDISLNNIESIIEVLLNHGDMFPEDKDGFWGGSRTNFSINRITKTLLKRIESKDLRFDIIAKAIANSNMSIYTIVECIVSLGYDHGVLTENPPKPIEEQTVSISDLKKLQKIVSKSIKEWLKIHSLFNTRKLLFNLFRLSEWDDSIDIKKYIAELTFNDLSLVEFLYACLNRSVSQIVGNYDERVIWSFDLETLSELIDINLAYKRVMKFTSTEEYEDINDSLKYTIKLFVDTYDGKIEDDF